MQGPSISLFMTASMPKLEGKGCMMWKDCIMYHRGPRQTIIGRKKTHSVCSLTQGNRGTVLKGTGASLCSDGHC